MIGRDNVADIGQVAARLEVARFQQRRLPALFDGRELAGEVGDGETAADWRGPMWLKGRARTMSSPGSRVH